MKEPTAGEAVVYWRPHVYFRPMPPGAMYGGVHMQAGERPPTWKRLGRIDLYSRFSPLREVAACRVVSADGQCSVDTWITRELWVSLWPDLRGREW